MKSSFKYRLLVIIFISFQFLSCAQQQKTTLKKITETSPVLKMGAEKTEVYLPLLKGKNIAIVANQTSVLDVLQRAEVTPNVMGSITVTHHLVDYLHTYKNINVKKVFAPEHGFRGKADAGETVVDGIDTKTQLPIISLYGKNKKPSQAQLKNIDVVVFDIQDVGARFYTYISSLHYVMEACAEANIPVIILDRPNPNAHYIDGPVLEMAHTSFVGMHPVPVVYGMTIGEYGQMINGEKWLKNNIKCNLTVITLNNYTHNTPYNLPIKPSPNLPNATAINLYPSLCFFEGTNVSAGRGTSKQFQIYGAPYLTKAPFSFTPKPNQGAKYPKYKGQVCYGENLQEIKKLSSLNLSWLLKTYKKAPKKAFFNNFFTKLAGTKKLQLQIEQGIPEKEIHNSWKKELAAFKKIRAKYLLYN
ncbi:exo-beta-N-acetylmuramidase NamZ domain-containing protein [Tenacibaculum aestuariivivum]|uniref:exo-beta-N-acetylmuramidase NamZ family protein n=1 Tax=Tenacibaculum aestuariivivum TaxID=2006131 RepID=UPI003AB8A4E1